MGLAKDYSINLSECAREQIHIPGMVQPHGLLLVVDEASLTISQVSVNAMDLINIEAHSLVGRPIEDFLGTSQCIHLKTILENDDLLRSIPLKMRLPDRENGRDFHILIHRFDREIIFEAEPLQEDEKNNSRDIYDEARRATLRIQSAETEESLSQIACEQVRRIIGFDRVLMYRFEPPEYTGLVVAESQGEISTTSYLGHHFPASDIPDQARKLYTVKRIGYIPDVNYMPTGLLRSDSAVPERPLDMTHCALRSVSPVHLEFLRNMGVGATLTLSLVQNGKLWGLITCHHLQPKLISVEARLACSFLSQIIETQLSLRWDGAERAYRMRTSASNVRFIELVIQESSISGLAIDPTKVLDYVDAKGAAIVVGTKCTLLGQTPSEDEIPGLLDLLKQSVEQGVYSTDSLVSVYPHSEQFKDIASGMLGAEISRERGEYLLWFRPEQHRRMIWAGNPEKPAILDVESGRARIHPRKSFESWATDVQCHSMPWKPCEIDAARRLIETISRVLAGSEERMRDFARREQVLRTSRDKADAENRAKSQFLANMSHEIRTPITSIIGFAEMLYDLGDIRQAPQERVNAIHAIERNSRHLVSIINDILDLAKIEADRVTIELLPCETSKLIADTELMVRPQAESKQLKLLVEYQGAIPEHVTTDPVRFKQILVNLLNNAVKFTEQGSVRVVTRFCENPAPRLEVDVIDTGIGIPIERQVQIFEPFVQADDSMTRRFGGTGLGLTISKKLAEALGGGLEIIDSQPEKGTTFRLSIAAGDVTREKRISPTTVSQQETERFDAVTARPVRSIAGARVLLAEDSVDNQRLIRYLLERAGAVVESAEDGKEACAMAMPNSPSNTGYDVILMDMQMPEMDGYEATALLRDSGYDGPIIAVTAHAMPGDRQKCISAGCDDYLTKPIDRKLLISTIAKFLKF